MWVYISIQVKAFARMKDTSQRSKWGEEESVQIEVVYSRILQFHMFVLGLTALVVFNLMHQIPSA